MGKEYKGKATISGRTYDVEVRNGIRYINGVTVDEFCRGLSQSELFDLARIGKESVDAEREGKPYDPQSRLNEIQTNKPN